MQLTNLEVAKALLDVIGQTRWRAVALADAFMAIFEGEDDEVAARRIHDRRVQTLRQSLKDVQSLRQGRTIMELLHDDRRRRIGSAENPITKMFPATITEERFVEAVEDLTATRPNIEIRDERGTGHTYIDFSLIEGDYTLPINVKTAGTRFEKARSLVGLDPDDCVPIPAYKAHGALDVAENLVYAVSVDYDLVSKLDQALPDLFDDDERIVWQLLNEYVGPQIRGAEDAFIFAAVRKYWYELKTLAQESDFHVISARKAVRLLQTKPERTPGIGLRAWGTGASAEVNVHVSIDEDMTPWPEVAERITTKGIFDIISAVNRKRMEEVYDPEI